MDDQTLEDLKAIRAEAARREVDDGYLMGSVRSIALDLKIPNDRLPAILQACVDGGFDYCLDHTITMTGHHEAQGEKPQVSVCYWGPDQLRSRLDSLSNVGWQLSPRR